MDDVKADASGGFRRIEVLTGPARRRRWSDDEKGRIVAEALVEGASVSEVARPWQVCSQQVFTWRREARKGHLALPGDALAPPFVPLVSEAPPVAVDDGRDVTPHCAAMLGAAPSIEIQLAGAVVRVPVGMDVALLTQVLRAVRASAA